MENGISEPLKTEKILPDPASGSRPSFPCAYLNGKTTLRPRAFEGNSVDPAFQVSSRFPQIVHGKTRDRR